MLKKSKLLSAAVVATAAFMASPSHADTMGTPKISAMSILNGLENPWDMAFAPNGDMFFTEKCKGLSVKTSSGVVNVLGMKGSKGYGTTNGDLFCSGQAGMMGVAVDPNFKKNRRVYVASTSDKYHGSGCKTNFEKCDGNIVMRLTLDKNNNVTDRTDIVKDIQYKPFESDHPFGGPGAHNGNRLRFGPEGYLWATTGDRHRGIVPQSPKLLGGNVLRIDTDGKAHPGNKPPRGFDKRMYTYGHRNVQGLLTNKNLVIATEHGPKGGDELNKIFFNKNYGWPISSYGKSYKNKNLKYFKSHKDQGFEEPIYSFVPSIGISEIIEVPENFDENWKNSILVTSLNGKSIYRLKFETDNFDKLIYIEKIFVGKRIRDIKYLEKNNIFILALESFGEIGILQKK